MAQDYSLSVNMTSTACLAKITLKRTIWSYLWTLAKAMAAAC